MKKLLLIIVLLLISAPAIAQVYEEGITANDGTPLVRFTNTTNTFLSCYYQDQVNYFTFNLPPRATSQWYPSYGYYEWECK